ncbi:hypothetical protein [[Mycobacterium] zoologicum]|uniref:hypothetical protein n=1 Tax=[Mycobacterium] zoologicum TaxID=2872311 RepID=UPI00272A004C|nr:hypothetical protein [Mycolicibacter sp. MYC101]MEB3063874.1 hypothetical protein [Mycolicibacter sp. MYC101]
MASHSKRMIGVGATAAAFLAGGMTSVAAPTAHADLWDVFVDPLVNVFDGGTAADSFTDFSGSAVALDPSDFGQSVNDALQVWLASDSGAQVAEMLNAPFVYLFGRDLIGNGVDDFTDANTSLLGSTGLYGDLGDGGFLFGNGGAGADGVAGVNDGAGWAGGSAGMIGNGGDGGAGVAGAAGGAGGDGGSMFGNGGNGGAGGAGGNAGSWYGNGGDAGIKGPDTPGGQGGTGGVGGAGSMNGSNGTAGAAGTTPGSHSGGGGGCVPNPGGGGPGGPGSGTGCHGG